MVMVIVTVVLVIVLVVVVISTALLLIMVKYKKLHSDEKASSCGACESRLKPFLGTYLP